MAHDVPWPSLGGGLVRLAQVVEAMGSVTDLDLFVIHDQNRSRITLPPTVAVHRSKSVQFPRASPQIRWRLEWAARRGVPLELVMTRADLAPRVALQMGAPTV